MSKKHKARLQKAVSVITSLTTVLWLSGAAMLMPFAAKAVVISEGDLIRGPDGIKVYIVNANGYKRHIFNPAVFDLYGHLKWSNIKSVDQATLDSYTISDIYRAAGDYKVYQTADDGVKKWFDMTAEQFVAKGYNWNQVFVVNASERDYYSTGSSITYSAPVVAGGLTVALASDTAAAGVIAENAARVPFTKVNLTAGSDADVKITSMVVERKGQADDAVFDSLILIDGTDQTQIGLAQSLNALHTVTFDEAITVAKGTTKSLTIAGNMVASLDNYTGQVASLSLKSIATTATLSGALPITGNSMTMNSNLSIGAVTATIGSLDPGAAVTKEVGTKAYAFAAVKLTAGSVEDITIEQFKFNQSGSAATTDLSNVKVKVDGTEYAATGSSDGKYYNAVLGSGLVVTKGTNKEFTLVADIAGGSNRTVLGDIYKKTDIVVKGNLYGYYLTAGGGSAGTASAGGFSSDTNPFFKSYTTTIGKGTLRVDKNSVSAPATNIAEGGTGQLLGAFTFEVVGEPVRISDMRLEVDIEGVGSSSDITLMTIYDKDGNAVLGPLDPADSTSYGDADTSDGSVRYQSALIVPVGVNTYTIKGNLNTDFTNNDTVRLGMNTPATRVATAKGTVTGETVTATPASAVWASVMTIKAGSLALSVSTQPVAQNLVVGTNGFEFAKFIFDASASGEDVRVTSFKVQQIISAAAQGDKVHGLVLYDGATALNTGSDVVNPTDTTNTTRESTFNLSNPLVVPKASVKTIVLKGNISASAGADSTHAFGIDASPAVSATGASTGTSITASVTASNGQTMTMKSGGAYAVALDSGTHSGKMVYAGATGVEMARYRFNATSEAINLTNLRLKLGSASTSQDDLVKVYLYDTAGTKVSEAIATTTAQIDFTIASSAFVIPKDGEKVMIVKADLATIGTGLPGTTGHVLAIDYFGSSNRTSNKGIGASSGTSINSDTAFSTAQSAVYLFKGIPKLQKLSLSTNVLVNATQLPVYKFKVSAQGNDIDLYKITLEVATTSMTVEDVSVVDVTESAELTLYASSTAAGIFGNVNVAGSVQLGDIFFLAAPGSADPTVLANHTPRTVSTALPRTFEVRLTTAAVATGDSLSIQLNGDPSTGLNGALVVANDANGWPENDFIWSDRSATSTAQSRTAPTWTNGYLLDGLPSSNMVGEVLSK